MKFTEILSAVSIGLLILLVLVVTLRSCGDRAATPLKEKEDPSAVTHYVSGYYIHEVHPKPGVTCFVFRTEGISCIKE